MTHIWKLYEVLFVTNFDLCYEENFHIVVLLFKLMISVKNTAHYSNGDNQEQVNYEIEQFMLKL